MSHWDFFVGGTPVAQPRARAGKSSVYTPRSAKLLEWKARIRAAAKTSGARIPKGNGAIVNISVGFKHPESHYEMTKGRALYEVVKRAFFLHTQKPDVDNIAKAILDALTDDKKSKYTGAWVDDSCIAELRIRKAWGCGIEGMYITIKSLDPGKIVYADEFWSFKSHLWDGVADE